MTLAEKLFADLQAHSAQTSHPPTAQQAVENAHAALAAARIFRIAQEEDEKQDRPENSGGEAIVPG